MTVMETVRDMAAAGSAVVMVCHDMEVVSDFADRLVVMANGEILGRGTCADVFATTASCRAPSLSLLGLSRLRKSSRPRYRRRLRGFPRCPILLPLRRSWLAVLNVIDYMSGDTAEPRGEGGACHGLS